MAGDGGVNRFARHAFADVWVIGDGFERDVRHGLVFEAGADALARMRKVVVIEQRSHQPLFAQGEGHTRGVAGDPASALFFCYVGGSAGATGWVEDEVARVGGHEKATGDDFRCSLYYIKTF